MSGLALALADVPAQAATGLPPLRVDPALLGGAPLEPAAPPASPPASAQSSPAAPLGVQPAVSPTPQPVFERRGEARPTG
ncbi:MAG: hypothetical protein ACK4E4_05915, partial [Rhodocyclaceae bacterium]